MLGGDGDGPGSVPGRAVHLARPREPSLAARAGAKMVRFRREAIAKWEAEQEGKLAAYVPPGPAPRVASGGLLRGQKARRTGD